jgi:hypothetical protein
MHGLMKGGMNIHSPTLLKNSLPIKRSPSAIYGIIIKEGYLERGKVCL